MIRVRLPATTANLGPGFDCMGLALDLWNDFALHPGGAESWSVETHGEGAGTLETGPANLVLSVMREELARLGTPLPSGGRVVAHNAIPPASGLGSSSTATLAGLLFAHALARADRGEDPAALDRGAVLERAVAVEGHGDNVAPALLGGFVIVVPDGTEVGEGGVLVQRIPHVPVGAVVCVPEIRFLTSEARAALPERYSKADAIFNIGRAMLVAEALRAGDDALLARAMRDRIHEPYRLPKIPGAAEAIEAARDSGAICAALSGAGPGTVAFARNGFDPIGASMKRAFAETGVLSRYWVLRATDEGAGITRLPV